MWLLIRLTGITLGIVTLLGLASGYLNVEFKPFVENLLVRLQFLSDYIIQPDAIEWALDWLRQHFAWVPKPEPHWKPVYTLSALIMLSWARRMPWYMLPFAVVCALVPAILSSTKPLDSLAVALWPLAGYFAFFAIADALNNDRSDAAAGFAIAAATAFVGHIFATSSAALVAWPIAGYFAFIAIFEALGKNWRGALGFLVFALFAVAVGEYVSALGLVVSPLVLLAIAVGFWGTVNLVLGLLDAEGTHGQNLRSPSTAIGIDILGTLGGAVALGYLLSV